MNDPFLSLWWNFFKALGVPLFTLRFRTRYEGPSPKTQFIMVANHTRDIDPALISWYLKHPAHWLSAQEAFINPFRRVLLTSLGAFQIKRYESDLLVVKRIIEAVRNGKSIAMFPYGNASWDGLFEAPGQSTLDLVRFLKIPVLAVRAEGVYLSFPRWARKKRVGPLLLKAALLEPDEAIQHITFSEWDWQRERMEKYLGKDKAAGLERILWFCPYCGAFRSLTIDGDTAKCRVCRSIYTVDDYGFVNGSTIAELLSQQKGFLSDYLLAQENVSLGPVGLFIRKKGELRFHSRYRALLSLHLDGILIEPEKKGPVRVENEAALIPKHFYYERIKNQVGFQKTMLEFAYEEEIVRLRTDDSSLLILKAIEQKKGGVSCIGL